MLKIFIITPRLLNVFQLTALKTIKMSKEIDFAK